MKAYSLDFRQKIVDLYDRGSISQQEFAERFCVSVFFVKKLFRQRRLKGTVAPLVRSGWQKGLVTSQIEEFLISLYREEANLTLFKAAAHIEAEFGVILSNPTICRAVRRLNLRSRN